MLHTLINEFQWSVDNFGATYSDAGFGTSATSGAANTKGTAVSLLAGSSVTEDVWAIAICFVGGDSSAAVRNHLVDILIDEAGGSSWTVRIPNLLVSSGNANAMGGYWYYFPLAIKAGSSIGFQTQCNAASATLRCGVKLYGKPSRPELVKTGSKVEAFGVNTTTSEGTTITPGSSAMGSYTASLGTTANANWWWQGGLALNDTTMAQRGYLLDIAAGDATNKKLCCENIVAITNGQEQMGKEHTGIRNNLRMIAIGESVYARAAAFGAAPDTGPTAAAYGLSG